MRSPFILAPIPLLFAACGGPEKTATGTYSVVCQGSPAPRLIDRSLCVCRDMLDVGALEIRSGRNGQPASAAINGRVGFVNYSVIDGSLIAYEGLHAAAALNVERDLETAGDLGWAGRLKVGSDLSVGGDLEGIGELSVGGELRVRGEDRVIGFRDVQSKAPWASAGGPPCGCDPASMLDVAQKVKDAKTSNENAIRGLRTTRLDNLGLERIGLETGSYYFEGVRSIGKLDLAIRGVVALHIDGDLDLVGDAKIAIAPGSSLDLYVAGAAVNVGRLTIVNDDPSAFRLFVGGPGAVAVGVGLGRFSGAIYAPTADLNYVGDTEIEGAIFAREIHGVGRLRIAGALPEDVKAPECELPPADGEPRSDGVPNGNGSGSNDSPGPDDF
jgi:hypothetical protein